MTQEKMSDMNHIIFNRLKKANEMEEEISILKGRLEELERAIVEAGGRLENCVICPRDGDGPLFRIELDKKVIVADLKGYAIITVEEYSSLLAIANK